MTLLEKNRNCSLLAVLAMVIFGTATLAQGPGGPSQPDTTMDAKTKTETIDTLKKDLRENYVFPDVGDKLANMLEERQAHGEYNSITSAREFAQTLTKQMSDVAHDGHLRVRYSEEVIPPSLPNGTQRPPDARDLLRMAKSNYAFEDVKRLNGNIGYLKLNGFADPELGGPTVAAAMAFLTNTDAMIIDLRDNHGGSPNMVALLISYFFSGDHPVKLNDFAYRIAGTKDYETSQSWTLPYVPGQRYMNKEVYVLTSHATFSGGEEFTYDMKTQKRATIVGETTGGGANPQHTMRLGDHFAVSMPQGHPINPITHTNWEGVGVKPDIDVPAADALKVAEKTALEHLIAKTTDEQELGALKYALATVEAKPEEQKTQ